MSSDLTTLRDHLMRRFEQQRVVFWHDPDSEYVDELDELDLGGVTIVRVNDESMRSSIGCCTRSRHRCS